MRHVRNAVLSMLAASLALACSSAPHALVPVSPASSGAPTPDSLAALFLQRFASGTAAAFDSVDPDAASRAVMHGALQRKRQRDGNLGRVVWRGGQQAVLLLTGTVKADNGSDESNLVRHFSGFYLAAERGGTWSIVRRIPIDTLNHIHGQTLHVDLVPGQRISVVDTLTIAVGSAFGFAVRMNNDVRIARLRLDGDSTDWAFGGGVLWVGARRARRASLTMEYAVRDANRAEGDTVHLASSDTTPPYGAFHNTDGWHPFFGYASANDECPMTLTVRVPAAYYLTTTLPQTESVANGVRTVVGRTEYPAWLLSLIYDRDWHPMSSDVDGVRFETFTTSAFHFGHDTLAAALRRVDRILGTRFGGPTPKYVAVVEDRLLGKRGLSVRMTDAVISGSDAAYLDESGIRGPSAVFGHEVSHAWTMNATGPASNMLREGWATFSEALVLGAEHGPDVEADFWNRLRNGYMLGSEGRLSILGNPDNGGVHYSKGAWIFHMFDLMLGDSAFDRGMREYIEQQAEARPAGYAEFIGAMSHAAGRDLTSFAMPWFSEKKIPDVRAHVVGRRVVVSQVQDTPPFDLPLELALVTARGTTVRRSIHLRTRADTIDVGDIDSVAAVRVDPDHRLLLQRHWGEHARFELPVAESNGAKTVALVGDFSLEAVPATRVGDTWVVELPLSEGRYVWTWQLDGKPRAVGAGGDPGSEGDPSRTGIRVVRPLELLTGGYPR